MSPSLSVRLLTARHLLRMPPNSSRRSPSLDLYPPSYAPRSDVLRKGRVISGRFSARHHPLAGTYTDAVPAARAGRCTKLSARTLAVGRTGSLAAPSDEAVCSTRIVANTLTVPFGQVIAAIALVEGISAAMAEPAKSLSALRRLMEPSARALARSSKERLVVSWLTRCPLARREGHY
jgi:hypothetical protein